MDAIEAALAMAKSSDRVCPVPDKWHTLWKMLPDKKRRGSSWEPSLPLILTAWNHSSNLDKMLRLQDYINWAAEHDMINEVLEYLGSLSEKDWHHLQD